MIISGNDLKGMEISATDGIFGKVQDLFFDDEHWVVRYFVVRTGKFLERKDVLISPISIQNVNLREELIELNLTKKEVEESPDMSTQLPVSRQKELEFFEYYNWPAYWVGAGPHPWVLGPYGVPWTHHTREEHAEMTRIAKERTEGENDHLRSLKEVEHYHIHSKDDERFGHVQDFLIDSHTFTIRYLEVDTVNWLPSKTVLMSPSWLREINWEDRSVDVIFSKGKIKHAPKFEMEFLDREYEKKLFEYYKRTPYWEKEKRREEKSKRGEAPPAPPV